MNQSVALAKRQHLQASVRSILDPEISTGVWTDNSTKILCELIAQKLTTSKIAALLSKKTGERFSRNAVIGKARRMNIPLYNATTDPKAKRKKRVPPRVAKMKLKSNSMPSNVIPLSKPTPPTLTMVSNTPRRLSILEIARGECYWPVDVNETPATFCGHPTVDGTSWCPAHRKLGYVPPYQRPPRLYR
jgi:GcrA cell cycle regulator